MSNSRRRRRYAHVNSRSSPRVSQSATPPNDGQGDDRLGRKRGSGSQTSIGPHSRAVGAQFRNVARARETSQETPLVFPAGETDAHPGGAPRCADPGEGGQSSWKGTRRRAMERDEREGALLDVCYLPVLRAAEAPTGQSVYRHVPALEQRFACYSTVFRACLPAPQKLARVSTDRSRSI